jgi:hypothetical protein
MLRTAPTHKRTFAGFVFHDLNHEKILKVELIDFWDGIQVTQRP